jgi:Transposase
LKNWIIRHFQYISEKAPNKISYYSTGVEVAHGRIEKRSIKVLSAGSEQLIMPGIQQIAILERYRKVIGTNKETIEWVYLATNLPKEKLSAKQFLEIKRDYWHIENKLHYIKDSVYTEDRSTIRKGFGPQNMASLRNFSISILIANGIKNVKRLVDNAKYCFSTFMQQAFAF